MSQSAISPSVRALIFHAETGRIFPSRYYQTFEWQMATEDPPYCIGIECTDRATGVSTWTVSVQGRETWRVVAPTCERCGMNSHSWELGILAIDPDAFTTPFPQLPRGNVRVVMMPRSVDLDPGLLDPGLLDPGWLAPEGEP
jgi:hypothetical protein